MLYILMEMDKLVPLVSLVVSLMVGIFLASELIDR